MLQLKSLTSRIKMLAVGTLASATLAGAMVAAPSPAEAYHGGPHFGHHRMGGFHHRPVFRPVVRVGFHGPRFYRPRPYFARPVVYRPYVRPVVYRPYVRPIVYRPYVRPVIYRPYVRRIAYQPAYYNPCFTEKRVRFTPWGRVVRFVRVCR